MILNLIKNIFQSKKSPRYKISDFNNSRIIHGVFELYHIESLSWKKWSEIEPFLELTDKLNIIKSKKIDLPYYDPIN